MDNEEIEKQERAIWEVFLSEASSEDLFRSVITASYDDMNLEAPLVKKILNDPSVDKAVVLAFYWRLAPRYKKQYLSIQDVPDWLKEDYQLVSVLEEKFLSGFYKNEEIYYNPKSDFETDWTTDYLEFDPSRKLPVLMEQEINGNTFVDEPYDVFDNGLPFDLAEKIFDLM
ncbi:DUF4274 domain-containing protein [Listeria sp. FSL L7-1485]|uniref:DUF4274 domain-containing protein n=1 Tax=Listeria immobilis TaxID=2713502 RepID=A0A7X1C8Q2_9LIST|nr:DUF4274 domain-containing protein [Listeria immobilis]MBC1488506.1 DUF4274 domain-containing protein [Listeria immobilis]MBC1535019.1 DUF4274 domain-containing protein [Listeria immobilis]